MNNRGNVYNLNSSRIADQFDVALETPELVKSAKRISEKRLTALLQYMFEHVDDCLFKYADKAESNKIQTLYFDAMRIIRLKKDEMSRIYHQEFSRLFHESVRDHVHSDINATANNLDVMDFSGLSLVEEDDLEESLAISNMESKILNQFKQSLYALAKRLDFVMNEVGFTSEQNPLSPKVVCTAFSSAVDSLELDIEIKLIIYKLFDKFVVSNIETLYDEVNNMFIAAGILPSIRFKVPLVARHRHKAPDYVQNDMLPEIQNGIGGDQFANSSVQSPLAPSNNMQASLSPTVNQPHSEFQATIAPQAIAQQLPDPFSIIQQLLLGQKGGEVSSDEGDDAPSGFNITTNGQASYITQDIIAGLSGLQQSASVDNYSSTGQPSAQFVKSHLVKEIGRIQGDDKPRAIERAEDDTIDIVSMMFDYILADGSIPEVIKSLIIRLQIPMVKVAIIDKAFFSKKNHPARQLLNELAYVAATLDESIEPGEDPIYVQVEYTVNRVLSEFDNNTEIFEILLSEFKAFLDEEIEANKLAEELIEHARETVAIEIARRMENNRIPDDIKNFIMDAWKDVLKFIGVRDECEGSAWDTAIKTMDDLIWSVQPKLVVSERHKLIKLIPKLLNALQDGLVLISYGQDNIDSLFQCLEKLHVLSLRFDQVTSSPPATHGEEIGVGNNNGMLHDNPKNEKPANDIGPDELASAAELAESTEDEFSTSGMRHDDYEQDLRDPELKSSNYYQFVQNMELGTWLEFATDEQTKRGKLSWKCDFTGEFTFVDRKYQVVADFSMRELINRLEAGSAYYVENIPMFDRAINSIISGLKNCIDSSPNDLVIVEQK